MKVGDKLKDNDPRMANRVLTITAIGLVSTNGAESVRAKGRAGPEVSISTRRIYSDGKPRRSGFDLVPANGAILGPRSRKRSGLYHPTDHIDYGCNGDGGKCGVGGYCDDCHQPKTPSADVTGLAPRKDCK